MLLAIAVCAVGDLSIFGFSIKNILSILIVLILGWKNGMLVGATGGITIGVVLGIISGTEPMMIAAYAISGLIAGILNKFGRIGVVVGFIRKCHSYICCKRKYSSNNYDTRNFNRMLGTFSNT